MNAKHLFELMIAMLPVIIALHYLAQRLRLPPAVALLVGGALVAFLPELPDFSPDPEMILLIFLPPLLIDGAWGISVRYLRRHMIGVASLAVGAVVFTTLVVAMAAHWLFPSLPWAACAVLGAIVSPPDAVSARAVLERVKLPRRLTMLLEGESLLNDASGLVLFRFAIAASATGSFSTVNAVQTFVLLAIGGAVVGCAIGALWVFIARRLQDEYLIIVSTLVVPWAAYVLGEHFKVSGVIATVAAGLVCGTYQYKIFTAAARMRGSSFWTVTIFLMEAAVFMLIGLSLRGVVDRVGGFPVVIDQMGIPVLVILAALLLARFGWIFLSDAVIVLLRKFGMKRHTPLGARGALIVGWAGVRGVVTLALALSLPQDFPGRDFIIITAVAVILVTVLVQGTTLGALIRWTGITPPESDRTRLTLSEAEAILMQTQLAYVQSMAYDSEGELKHPMLLEQFTRKAAAYSRFVGQEEALQPNLHAHYDLVLAAIAASRLELNRLHRVGDIDEHTLGELQKNLDLEELNAIAVRA
ncbi:Na+/H+ antiporter [Diaphorobacter sp. HDW4B]|uniref:Na+/H+ antiporter n=1 Tax=Diaphorobacter sp. HDW4B TaxID=2714925 RepID=UPI00140B0B48|nr:Na+/H+ antiporter [Diaphorobacter sp. HDW4B]QIL69421.1 Na+/H+ antiporter [Diaphorobacter sp. HDW4B]